MSSKGSIVPSTLTLFTSLVALASAAKITPCANGTGPTNGCGGCRDDLAAELAPWSSATRVEHFDFPEAAAPDNGGGYYVWFSVEQPDDTCRFLVMDPYTTDKGSIDARLSGNVVLSTAHSGCYWAHIGSRGYSAGFCCGNGDCTAAGGKPWTPPPTKKRDQIPSRIENDKRPSRVKRQWNRPPPASSAPLVQCSNPVPKGETYTKQGSQQVDADQLNCNGGGDCRRDRSMAVAQAKAISSESSTTITNGVGVSISITEDAKLFGAGISTTVTGNYDWSKAVSDSLGVTDTSTHTTTKSFSIGMVKNLNFNQWFAPLMDCQAYTITCQGVEQQVESCSTHLENGAPAGASGVMVVG